jgi:hypothetical protein
MAETAAERRDRRQQWFDNGAYAFPCVCKARPPYGYVCPQCVYIFGQEHLDAGVVTDEHVPPQAVGGCVLVLTCVDCNKRSGHLLDEAMADEEKLRTFGQPHALGALPGAVTVGGVRNNGSIRFDGSTFLMLGDPGQNKPGTAAAHTEVLESFGPGEAMELRFRIRHHPGRAALGWMRAAYLAAFAVYGYRYALQPAFDPLRQALADPDGTNFIPKILGDAGRGPLDCSIVEVSAPAELAGARLVIFGPRHIFLPPAGAPPDWFAALPTVLNNLGEAGASSVTVWSAIGRPFPERPMHLMDG